MGSSAFELLILPIFMTTFGAILAGAAFIGLMNSADILIVRLTHLVRMARPRPTVLHVVPTRPKSARPRVAIRPRLVG